MQPRCVLVSFQISRCVGNHSVAGFYRWSYNQPVHHSAITLTDVLAVVGALVGTAGFVLGILNYLRDAPKVRVTLLWDMKFSGDRRYDVNKNYCLVRVTNTGRRPIYVSHASLKLPKGYPHTHLVLGEALQGNKLAEGDPPKTYVGNQDDMEQ